jgi:hypothetical protein
MDWRKTALVPGLRRPAGPVATSEAPDSAGARRGRAPTGNSAGAGCGGADRLTPASRDASVGREPSTTSVSSYLCPAQEVAAADQGRARRAAGRAKGRPGKAWGKGQQRVRQRRARLDACAGARAARAGDRGGRTGAIRSGSASEITWRLCPRTCERTGHGLEVAGGGSLSVCPRTCERTGHGGSTTDPVKNPVKCQATRSSAQHRVMPSASLVFNAATQPRVSVPPRMEGCRGDLRGVKGQHGRPRWLGSCSAFTWADSADASADRARFG